jgi:aminomethyltransferase
LADLSAVAKVSVRGRDVPKLARTIVQETPAAKPLGVTKLADNSLACRLGEDQLLLLGIVPRLDLRVAGFELRASALTLDYTPVEDVAITNVTSAYAGFALFGDGLEEMLRRLTALDIASMPANSCARTNVAGINTLLVRMGKSDFISLQMYVAWEYAEYMWDRLLEAGSAWHIAPMGLEAWANYRAR